MIKIVEHEREKRSGYNNREEKMIKKLMMTRKEREKTHEDDNYPNDVVDKENFIKTNFDYCVLLLVVLNILSS